MSALFSPISIRSVKLRNRIGVSPMCMYWSDNGLMNDWHLVHLGSRAIGGAALVVAEATAVEPRGRISPRDAGIWSDAHVEPLIPINRFLRQYGAVPGVQLAHAGRKAGTAPPYDRSAPRRSLTDAEGGWATVAPSAAPFRAEDRIPHELTVDEIADVQRRFVDATRRAVAAGYEWVEFHAAHGYLAHQFLSPLSNRRNDRYGGDFENRIRFVLETTQRMRSVWPDDKPFSVRISSTDWVEGGWTIEESVELSRRLRGLGVDVIAASSGGTSPSAQIPLAPGYQVGFAERIRREAGILTAAVGLITEPKQADAIVRNQQADLVLLAREFLRDPYWPLHAARALGQRERLTMPPPYEYVV